MASTPDREGTEMQARHELPSSPVRERSSSVEGPGSSVTTNTDVEETDLSVATPRRRDLVKKVVVEGGILNPEELPRADGSFDWLEDVDRQRAQALDHQDPVDVTVTRSQGRLGTGDDTPQVVFIPHAAHFNPEKQPQGPGHWSFVSGGGTNTACELAWAQLGGREQYGFADVRYPTAEEVWHLRQRMRTEGQDLTVFDGIDIAYVTGLKADFWGGTIDSNADLGEWPDSAAEDAAGLSDSEDGDKPSHDPTNGGVHDQTGAADLHRYNSINVTGKTHTVDVSPAVVDREEPHKFELPNHKGVWDKWKHADTMDWSKPADLAKLNAWRDQKLQRAGFPRKRQQNRYDYTEEQKRWAFGRLKKGNVPNTGGMKKLVKEFNEKFEESRSQPALGSLMYRMAQMYAKHQGQYQVGMRRGQAKKEEAQKKRKERQESGEIGRVVKRRRQSSKGAAEDGEREEMGSETAGKESRESEVAKDLQAQESKAEDSLEEKTTEKATTEKATTEKATTEKATTEKATIDQERRDVEIKGKKAEQHTTTDGEEAAGNEDQGDVRSRDAQALAGQHDLDDEPSARNQGLEAGVDASDAVGR